MGIWLQHFFLYCRNHRWVAQSSFWRRADRWDVPAHPFSSVCPTDEQLERIEKVPKRELRRRGINQHTLEKICSKMPVRATKLAQCLKVLGAGTTASYKSSVRSPDPANNPPPYLYW